MVTKEDLVFRQVITLKDGARVLLRPLLAEDRQALLDLFLPVAYDDQRFMRHNVNDAEIVSSWVENINYDKIFPLVSVVGDRIVGTGTLHFNEGPGSHRCELRIFLAKDFRKRGLGNKLIQALVDHARRRSMHMIEVQIVTENVEVIKAMQKMGFKPVCTFEDYFMLPDGGLRDVLHLTMRLRTAEDEF